MPTVPCNVEAMELRMAMCSVIRLGNRVRDHDQYFSAAPDTGPECMHRSPIRSPKVVKNPIRDAVMVGLARPRQPKASNASDAERTRNRLLAPVTPCDGVDSSHWGMGAEWSHWPAEKMSESQNEGKR
jgi:hypothetical protein